MAQRLGQWGGSGIAGLPRLIVTAGAARGLERCRKFLVGKNRLAAVRAGEAIERHFALLKSSPEIGRPDPELPELESWSSASATPAMSPCIATSRPMTRCIFSPFGIRKRPAVRKELWPMKIGLNILGVILVLLGALWALQGPT